MAITSSVALRNAMLDAAEAAIGVSPILTISSGVGPANAQLADTGTVLATLQLPADFMDAAANGVKAKAGNWQDLAADAAGVAGHYRISTSGGAGMIQGSVGITGSGADMELDNTNIAVGQQITITNYSLTM